MSRITQSASTWVTATGLYLLMLITVGILFVPKDAYADQSTEAAEIDKNKLPKSLVIYFSRSGNTEAMAMQIASRYQADIKNIRADDYSDDFSGSIKANIDAWTNERISVINPETVDMTDYRMIFLGSPIWWFRPAVPLWTFVGKNNFKGKKVVLFNTFNSRFKAENIEKFKKLLEQKGGDFLDHIYIRRGRVYDQIDSIEQIAQVRKLLISRERQWIEVLK